MNPGDQFRRRLALAIALPALPPVVLSASLIGLVVHLLPPGGEASLGDPRDPRSLLAAACAAGACLAVFAAAATRGLSAALCRAVEARSHDDRLERERLDLLADAMKYYAIFTLDGSGQITSWNEAAERILGYRWDEVEGRHVTCLYDPEDVRAGRPHHDLGEAAREGRSEDERRVTRKGGFRFNARVSLVAIRDPSGSLRGFTSVVHEVG